MNQDKAIQLLRQELPTLQQQFEVEKIGIFGSVARNEASENSDIDIVVRMPPKPFHLVHLKERLESLLQSSVDLVRYRPQMNPFLKERIDKEAVYA